VKTILISLCLLFSLPAMAGDIAKGKASSMVCSGCHGADGKAVIPGFPNLAGQDKQYLTDQLKNFRNKSRTGGQANIMYGMAINLSDADIDNLAAYFSSL